MELSYLSKDEQEWLKEWRKSFDSDSFKHPFEPPSWPLQPEDQNLSVRIERDRKIYLDPLCNFPIYLGETPDKKQLIIERLEKLERPSHSDITPLDVALSPDEQNQLHPSGYSFRYKEISKKMQLNNGI